MGVFRIVVVCSERRWSLCRLRPAICGRLAKLGPVLPNIKMDVTKVTRMGEEEVSSITTISNFFNAIDGASYQLASDFFKGFDP